MKYLLCLLLLASCDGVPGIWIPTGEPVAGEQSSQIDATQLTKIECYWEHQYYSSRFCLVSRRCDNEFIHEVDNQMCVCGSEDPSTWCICFVGSFTCPTAFDANGEPTDLSTCEKHGGGAYFLPPPAPCLSTKQFNEVFK